MRRRVCALVALKTKYCHGLMHYAICSMCLYLERFLGEYQKARKLDMYDRHSRQHISQRDVLDDFLTFQQVLRVSLVEIGAFGQIR